jgi:hypothetical protein
MSCVLTNILKKKKKTSNRTEPPFGCMDKGFVKDDMLFTSCAEEARKISYVGRTQATNKKGFLFFLALGFELRTSQLLGRYSST